MTDPIEDTHRAMMQALAERLDELFNGDARGDDRKVGFTLLVANFGQINYISNGQREDMVAMMKEVIARFEGRASDEIGHA